MGLPWNYWSDDAPPVLRPVTPRIYHPYYSSSYIDSFSYPSLAGPSWGVPLIPASSNPWINDTESMVRDYVEKETNGNRQTGPGDHELAQFEKWAKNDDFKKVMMDVLKARLELDWPHNYKALTILGKTPEGELEGLEEKLGKLADSAQTVEGFKFLKELAKPLHEKAKAAIAKKEEEEMKKKQAAIQAMWGGLWANDGYIAPTLQYRGYMGLPYPYNAPPGIARAATAEWPGKPPDGWSPTKITALPQIYPMSRTGYYATQPEQKDTPKPPSNWTVYVGIGPNPQNSMGLSKTLPLGLAELNEQAAKELADRGW